jgi:Flp pilus assembly protein TadD
MLKDDLDLEIGMEIIRDVARAAHYAHEQDIIHRDLKPANIIVREDLKPKLTDFGLAKNKDHQSVLTKTGAVLGTPYYLSPEQAQGRSKTLDRRADIYSLGVIMYELATGRLPFVGQTTVELYNRIIHDDPVPPTKIKPQLTAALEIVCLKAMAKDPDERYDTAEEFATDIQALLDGGTITAKADGPIKRFIKRLKKRGSIPLVVGSTVVLLALVVGGLTWHHKRTAAQRHARLVAQELSAIENSLSDNLALAEEKHKSGEAFLRQRAYTDAEQAAEAALVGLDKVQGRLSNLKFPTENKARAEELAKTNSEPLTKLRAAALVLRARATMPRDERGAIQRAKKDLEAVLKPADKGGVRPDDPAAHVAQGNLFVLTGAIPDAMDEYNKALERSPNSVRALLGRARALLIKEVFEEALSDATRGLKFTGGAAPPKQEESDDDEAKPIELEVLGEEDKVELAGLLLISRAQARLELGDATKALADAAAAAEKLPKRWEPKACEGDILAHEGRAYQARDAYAAAIQLAPQEAGPYAARAAGLLELGYLDLAYEDANSAVSLDARSLLALLLRAEAQLQRLNFEEAEQDAEAVQLRSQKRHWQIASRAERVLARLDALNDEIPDAHDHAKKARALNEHSSANKLLQARLELDPYFEGQFLDSAERLLKLVLRQRPQSLAGRRGLGLALQQKYVAQPERAQRKLEDALDLDPRDPETLAALARVLEAKAKKDDSRAEDYRAAAARNYAKAARYERDVRRRSGRIYATGLRNQLAGAKHTAGSQAEHYATAQNAYRHALLHTPSHVHAQTGLAAIAHLQGSFRRTGQHLNKAVEANPQAILPSVLNAYHYATADGLRDSKKPAQRALAKALALRGETTELLMCQLFLNGLRGTQTPDVKIKSAHEGFLALRKRDPYNETIYKKEIELFARLADTPGNQRDRKQAFKIRTMYRKQLRKVREELLKLQENAGDREALAKTLRQKATKLLKGKDELAPLAPAHRAALLTPWDPVGWWVLAEARAKSGEQLGSLAAAMRAAFLDEAYVAPLFDRLRAAGNDPSWDPTEVEDALMIDRDVEPFPKDLENLLSSTPLVARALVKPVDAKEAKSLFAELERGLNHDPTRLLSHAMLGALAFGVRRDEYAMLHLLFVGTVREDMGEAFYLAAVAAARRKTQDPRQDVLAIEALKSATRAGFKWQELAKTEEGLAQLRKSPLWKRIDE